MRTIAHISDLHFGKIDLAVRDALLEQLKELQPDTVMISGDITQRAKKSQFIEAKAFIDQIPFRTLTIPGNHDLPVYNMTKRFLKPLREYTKHISQDLNPFFADEEIALFGINTARSLSGLLGKISKKQLKKIKKEFDSVDASVTKIVMTHHPFVNSRGKKSRIIARAGTTLKSLERSGVDIVLAGHLHLGYTGDISDAYRTLRRSIIVTHAGTSLSTHHRREPNSFNLLRVEKGTIEISVHMWNGEKFVITDTIHYAKDVNHQQWRLKERKKIRTVVLPPKEKHARKKKLPGKIVHKLLLRKKRR